MSVQRFIHPKIWRSETLSKLTAEEQLFFIGVFSTCDDYGRRRAESELLKADIYPMRPKIGLKTIEKMVNSLKNAGLLRVYGDGRYMDIPTWSKYQKPKYRKESDIPPFSGPNCPRTGAESGPEPGRVGAMGCSLGLGSNSNLGRGGKNAGAPLKATTGPERIGSILPRAIPGGVEWKT